MNQQPQYPPPTNPYYAQPVQQQQPQYAPPPPQPTSNVTVQYIGMPAPSTPAPMMMNSTVVNVNTERPVNHCCHFLLTVFTAGLWLPFWVGACCGCCCERPCGC